MQVWRQDSFFELIKTGLKMVLQLEMITVLEG